MHNDVRSYYDDGVATEWSRLKRHPFEFEITKRHINRFVTPRAKIADIGGGPGRYAFYYAERGHEVSLFDLSPKNIEFATTARRGVKLAETIQGSATDLSVFASHHFDLTLCMGPLYHMKDESDRGAVITECRRITAPGAFLPSHLCLPWPTLFHF